MMHQNRLLEAIKLTRKLGTFGSAEVQLPECNVSVWPMYLSVQVTFLFQLVAWGQALVLSQYHSGENLTTVSTLDQIHVVFALLPGVEVRAILEENASGARLLNTLRLCLPGVISLMEAWNARFPPGWWKHRSYVLLGHTSMPLYSSAWGNTHLAGLYVCVTIVYTRCLW